MSSRLMLYRMELDDEFGEPYYVEATIPEVVAWLREQGAVDWPIVSKLNQAQVAKLEAHRHDRGEDGWKNEEPRWLMQRLIDEVEELAANPSWEEAADVANFAAMFVDAALPPTGETL